MTLSEQARLLLSKHGEVGTQPPSDWLGSVALPADLAVYYQDVGPRDVTIESYGNPFFLPSLSGLWEFQGGYRWNSLSGEVLPDWDDDWLVVADQGGAPFILSCQTGRILFAEHGTGLWEPGELFVDLITMAYCLVALGEVVLEAGDRFTDDDGYISAQFHRAAKQVLANILGTTAEADAVLASLGWG